MLKCWNERFDFRYLTEKNRFNQVQNKCMFDHYSKNQIKSNQLTTWNQTNQFLFHFVRNVDTFSSAGSSVLILINSLPNGKCLIIHETHSTQFSPISLNFHSSTLHIEIVIYIVLCWVTVTFVTRMCHKRREEKNSSRSHRTPHLFDGFIYVLPIFVVVVVPV